MKCRSVPNVLKFFLFADDTNIYFEADDLQELGTVVNNELKHLNLWLKVNRLSLNISKTNFLIFHSYQRKSTFNVTIKLGRKGLSQKEHLKYLVVFVDSHLNWNWKYHIQSITTKISTSIRLMYRLRSFVNLNVLKILYLQYLVHIQTVHKMS